MADWLQQLTSLPGSKQVVDTLGLPTPAELRRYEPGQPLLDGPALIGSAAGGKMLEGIEEFLKHHGVDVRRDVEDRADGERFAAIVFDASGVRSPDDLRGLVSFFRPAIRALGASGRLLAVGVPAEETEDLAGAATQQALDGFIRSAGKEMRDGATANLLRVAQGGERRTASTLRFLLSGRSAYVSGQTLTVGPTDESLTGATDGDRPLEGRVAVVTGAARGIGAAIAEVLSRDGAHVVGVDIPPQGDQLTTVANRVGGSTLQLDVTADDAPQRLASYLTERHGGVDIVVHNAGITRDKTLAGMDEEQWTSVMDVNLTSQLRLNEPLIADGVLRGGGRIVSLSSVNGIAGARGQTNYAASKAGIIGMVRGLAPELRQIPATVNAVAPGFIESEMTAAMPVGPREAGRRLNSMRQGGLPSDVAEAVAWLADPGSGGVTGQVVRVCGQSLLGA